MPQWAYEISPLKLALIMVAMIEVVSLIGLMLARRFVLPHLRFHDGVNDAISGTVQAIGVFYGITVGLIAVGVWNTNSTADDLVSKEAAAISGLYRDVSSYPEPTAFEPAGFVARIHSRSHRAGLAGAETRPQPGCWNSNFDRLSKVPGDV